jgi:predicted nucleic acid-binding protein
MVENVVLTDSGPIIDISQIRANLVWDVFDEILVPDIVIEETTRRDLPGCEVVSDPRFKVLKTTGPIVKKAVHMQDRHHLSQNDSLVLAHAVTIGADLILTDDLELRGATKNEHIRPVGTIGIIARAYRIGILDKGQTYELLDRILKMSSLNITEDIIEMVKKDLD